MLFICMFGCNNGKINSKSILQRDLKQQLSNKATFDPRNYKGYGFIFLTNDYQDGLTRGYFLPSDLTEEELLHSNYIKSRNKFPCISMMFRIEDLKDIDFSKSTEIDESDIFCSSNNFELQRDKGFTANFKYFRVFIDYINYEEVYEYDQSDKKSPHGKIKQNNECYIKWINFTDTSKIVELYEVHRQQIR